MSQFEDETSTHVSLLDEDKHRLLTASPFSFKPDNNPAGPSKIPQDDNNSKDSLKQNTQALKHQENRIDVLKKENFDLRLSLYHYQQKLSSLSSENLNNVLKENINLKVTLQTLTHELKKYKNVILDLTQTVEFLENRQCPKTHGMSPEEKETFEKAIADAEVLHEENDKLSKMIADMSAENVKLRSTIRSRNTSSSTTDHSSTGSVASDRQQQQQQVSEEHANVFKKFRQAKMKIEELQRIIQQQNSANWMAKDREGFGKINRQLEDELQAERQRNNRLMDDLEDKAQKIRSLQLELEQRTQSVQELKQQLRDKNIELDQLSEEIEDLQSNTENNSAIMDDMRQLQKMNVKLENEIQDREQEIDALEAEVEKLLTHLEKKERSSDMQEKTQQLLELEELIQARDDEIEMLKNELKTANESHDTNVEVFEEHLAKTREELDQKNEENKALVIELEELIQRSENTKQEYEDELEKQYREYNELVVAIRNRDVTLATLQGDFIAKADTMQREIKLLKEEKEEFELMKEEMKEIKSLLNAAYNELREKDEYIIELTDMVNSREQSQLSYLMTEESDRKWSEKLDFVEKEYKERIKRESKKAKERLDMKDESYRALEQKLYSANQKILMLNSLLDKIKKPSEFVNDRQDRSSSFPKSNGRLRKDLAEDDENVEKMREQIKELTAENHQQSILVDSLRKQLDRKETQLTSSLLLRDSLKEKEEHMENILFKQATGGHSFRERSGSAMSSF
ncbi:hypothetical protein BD560DRAFT_417366 [Blakeslea trispora]|nr:hypothetical protein BD560DRAFT_417366 [Blakeslea trispora]